MEQKSCTRDTPQSWKDAAKTDGEASSSSSSSASEAKARPVFRLISAPDHSELQEVYAPVSFWALSMFCVKHAVLAASTHKRAAVCLHAAHIAALREFWTDWLPTETPFLPQNVEPR